MDDTSSAKQTVSQYLEQTLSKDDTISIIDKLGIDTKMEDLEFIDLDLIEEATQGLKLIPKAKAKKAFLTAKKEVLATKNPTIDNNKREVQEKNDKAITEVTNKDEISLHEKSLSKIFVQECIAICIDRSGSMGCPFEEQKSWCDDGNQNALAKIVERRSRMDAVKQIFYAFRDRTETLFDMGSHHQIGLIQFDNEVTKMLETTSSLEEFEEIIDDMKQRGSTAIYSAIVEGCKMLQPIFHNSPKTDLRILVLSDGNNSCGISPEKALEEVDKIGAVVDAIIVGDNPDENLRRIVSASHGSCFQIRRLSEGFELMESETVVSLRARRGGSDKPEFSPRKVLEGGFSSLETKSIIDSSTVNIMTSKQPTVNKVVKINDLVNKSDDNELPKKIYHKRIMKELRDAIRDNNNPNNIGEGLYLFPDGENIALMKALIEGPIGTPFEHGVFVLDIQIPEDYPFNPPKVRFETPVYHCNINNSGGICLDILKEKWSPAMTILKVLVILRNMLINPNTDDALRQYIAELTIAHNQTNGMDTRYVDAAKKLTKQNASCSIEDWKKLWNLVEK